MLSQLAQRLAGLCGYAIVRSDKYARLRMLDNYKPDDNTFNEHLKQVFKRFQVACVLDVGANDGAYAESLRKGVGYEGWIHSFEPLPARREELQRKAANDPRWVIHTCALGAESGEAEFNVAADDVFSSFLAPDAGQPEKYAHSNRISEKVKVKVSTVAEMLPDILKTCGGGPVYLKMDTQGFDLQVFTGAVPALSHVVALQSELAFHTIYANAPDWKAMLGAIEKQGFLPSFLLPISFDQDFSILEADGIFVRAGTCRA
ncbi:MAG: hypothetical protein JWO94_1152 [Verrucomicrobiaceae bacterium]|nr:hypothetical protein [Verrucomicrobiaceae bacterium]